MKIYTYTLTGEWKGDSFVANGGRWTGDSEEDHPDYLIAYPDKVTRASLNREINPQIVDEIVEGK